MCTCLHLLGFWLCRKNPHTMPQYIYIYMFHGIHILFLYLYRRLVLARCPHPPAVWPKKLGQHFCYPETFAKPIGKHWRSAMATSTRRLVCRTFCIQKRALALPFPCTCVVCAGAIAVHLSFFVRHGGAAINPNVGGLVRNPKCRRCR